MSVADRIQELIDDSEDIAQGISNAYDEVQSKSGTIPQNKNTNNLATAIRSIPSGITPTGQISIVQNGTYDVTNYASASVNVKNSQYKEVSISTNNTLNVSVPIEDLGSPIGFTFERLSLAEETVSYGTTFLCAFKDKNARLYGGGVFIHKTSGSTALRTCTSTNPPNYAGHVSCNNTGISFNALDATNGLFVAGEYKLVVFYGVEE